MGRAVLLITGQAAVMHSTFSEHGRAYWSAEFGLILEKHGWLDFETAGPEAMEEASSLRDRRVVIVAWLPESCWRVEYVETLREYPGLLLLEGPFPEFIEEMLGVVRAGEARVGQCGSLSFAEPAHRLIENRFGRVFGVGHRSGPDPSLQLSPGGDPNPLTLCPRETRTRRPGLSRASFSSSEEVPFSERVGRAAVSLILTYRARFARTGRFFEDALEDALALLAVVRCSALAPPGPLEDALSDLVRDACARAPAEAGDSRASTARAVWALALAEHANRVRDPALVERAHPVLADVRTEWLDPRDGTSLLSRWRTLLALALSRYALGELEAAPLEAGLAFLTAGKSGSRGLQAWLDVSVCAAFAHDDPEPLSSSFAWLEAVAGALAASGGGRLGHELEGLTVAELALVVGALHRSGRLPAARRLWRVMLETLYDSRQGLFMNGNVVEDRLIPDRGYAARPLVALGFLSALETLDVADAPGRLLAEYTAEQRAAWTAAPYVFQPYQGVDADDCLVAVNGAEGRLPALWRHGNVVASAFQLFSHLVHVHTVEPLAEPFIDFRSGDAIVLEYLLIDLLEAGLANAGPEVVVVDPWPWGKHFALTVRHDVDRLLDREQFARLVELERSHGLAVSWFWLPDRLEPEQLRLLDLEPGHEVGLHAVRVDHKHAELAAVGRAVSGPIRGEAIHGAGDGWLGHLTVRAALDAGLLYTELAPPVADSPYARYPWVAADGTVGSDRIIGVSYNVSIDGMLGTQPGSSGGPGIYHQLLNHPDLNFDRLRRWVESLPRDARLDWTCAEVAGWWRDTHSVDALSIEHLPDEVADRRRFSVVSQRPVTDLQLRLPCRGGIVSDVLLDGQPAEWVECVGPSGIGIRVSLEASLPREIMVLHGQGAGFVATR